MPDSKNINSDFSYSDSDLPVDKASQDFNLKWSAASVMANRGIGWYLGFLFIMIAVSTGAYFLLKDVMTAGVIAFCGILIVVFGLKKPREINYSLTQDEIKINQKTYSIHDYKFFYVNKREAGGTAQLVPLKRFSPAISLNYSIKDENLVLGALSNTLPLQQQDTDVFDKMMHFIGF